ncbi:hypothetical protein PHLH7_53660 [Pseudomonas sp. Ost2]|nr:hypothetical protein PHLH7_53660 [Pseudomonas sp. Ost2]
MDWLYRRTKEVLVSSCRGKREAATRPLLQSVNRQAVIPLGLCLLVPDLAFADPAVVESAGESVRFNTAFIHGGEQSADIKAFLEGNSVLPGLYRVDIYLNRRDVRFSRDTLSGRVEPCLTLALLEDLGLDAERLKALVELPSQAAPSTVSTSANWTRPVSTTNPIPWRSTSASRRSHCVAAPVVTCRRSCGTRGSTAVSSATASAAIAANSIDRKATAITWACAMA